MKRRTFLASSVGASVAGLASGAGGQFRTGSRSIRREPRSAKNIIMMVSDGMSTGTLTLAETVHRWRHAKPTAWVSLWNTSGTRRSTAFTSAADSLVTDSAAGASAWSIGQKVNNNVLCILPDGTKVEPLLRRAARHGRATGVVTTTRVTHATPAGFYSSCPDRDLEKQIGLDLDASKLDVVMGGGAKYLPESMLTHRTDRPVVRDRLTLSAVLERATPPAQLTGMFGDSHVPYVLDRAESVPSLRQMTHAALRVLDARPEGFVLQIEGGRVDHAAHKNDAASLIAEQLDFDDAIREVVEFTAGRDDTLVIVTADHATANPGLTIYGPEGAKRLARALNATSSLERILETVPAGSTIDAAVSFVMEAITRHMGVTISASDRAIAVASLSGTRVSAFTENNTIASVLGGIIANSFGVAFVSPNHTSDVVEVTAFGPGADSIDGMIENTQLWNVMVKAGGLEA